MALLLGVDRGSGYRQSNFITNARSRLSAICQAVENVSQASASRLIRNLSALVDFVLPTVFHVGENLTIAVAAILLEPRNYSCDI